VLITGHRRENFGDGIEQICQAIATLAERFPDHRFVYPVHLNPNVLTHVNRLLGGLANVRLIAPQNYRNFVALMARCRLMLTDSGGVQEEAPSLGKPVLVMRDTTERPEGVAAGTALLIGPKATAIVEHATRLLSDEAAYRSMASAKNPYGDGYAAEQIVQRMRKYFATASATTLDAPALQPELKELAKVTADDRRCQLKFGTIAQAGYASGEHAIAVAPADEHVNRPDAGPVKTGRAINVGLPQPRDR
jgi:UDP-N-acetylglucosamine 2-epimerase (non-hydrolysing)